MRESKNPLARMRSYHPLQEMESVMENMISGLRWPTFENRGAEFFPIRVDFSENEKSYRLTAEIPGVEKDNLDITIEDGILTLQGEKKMENETQEENYHRIERSYGSFCRQMSLPSDADEGSIEANVKDGVLSVTIQKKEGGSSNAKKIKIR